MINPLIIQTAMHKTKRIDFCIFKEETARLELLVVAVSLSKSLHSLCLRYGVGCDPLRHRCARCTPAAVRCGRASVAIFLNMLKKIAVEKVGQWFVNSPQCISCAVVVNVAVASMRSLCHLNYRYAMVSLVTYSLFYRYPNYLCKVQLSPVPTSAI